MKSKHQKLLKAMMKTEIWTTGADLASRLGVSKRSVKNYIAELNQLYPQLISSSPKGYGINMELARSVLDNYNKLIPASPQERVLHILKKLLVSGNDAIDLYDIGDEIFVSYETIKKDMISVRKRLKEFDLFFETSGTQMKLEGNESDKRKMLSNLLYEEFSENFLSLSAVEKVFPDYDVAYLHAVVMETCKRYHYFINEYSLLNLVLDVVISIDRIKNDFTFSKNNSTQSFGSRENSLAKDIATQIESHYGIVFNEAELSELAVMLVSNLMKVDYESLNMNNISQYVGSNCMALMDNLKAEMANYEFLDVGNEDFILRFMVHINNLLLRLQNQCVTKNPLTRHVKVTCPLIFECAVALSDIINQVTGFYVDEHETAYIALHLGSLLSTHINMRNKISCILLFPQYYDYASKLVTQINDALGATLVIKEVITSVNELEALEPVDFIISTIRIPEEMGIDTVIVNPFLTDRGLDSIQYKIDRIKFRKKKARLKEQLQDISNPQFFYKNRQFDNEKDAISFMCELMEREGYVHSSFVDEVLTREKSYSNLYGNIAVPHSMKMNARKTGMFVLINEKAFSWNDGLVNIVLLFSTNREERAIFYDIFDNLIVLLLEATNAAKAINCNTYEEFINAVIDCF